MEVTCAILAGGKSKRMGRDKALIPVGDRALLSRVYAVAEEVFSDILVLSNLHTHLDKVRGPIVKDVIPRQGPMIGIVSALLYARTTYVFVLACDMPFLRKDAIEYVLTAAHGEDIVIPKTEKGFEPLHALYNRSCISPLLSAIERGRMKIPDIFPLLSVKVVEGKEVFASQGLSIFTNINTEEDLSRAQSLIG